MELGIYTFAETAVDPATGDQRGAGQRLRDLLEEIELADQVGLDVFGVGEHHRPDYAASAPAVVLAAAAARTRRIRLTSAVTVLSSDDPVRVWQQFATLDLLSGGRAELMAGRGSFIESFPLFGYDLGDYDALFADKLDLLLALREAAAAGEGRVTWAGRRRLAGGAPVRAPLDAQPVYPRPAQTPLPVWVAVGGTPASVARAGALGLPLAVAIIGGAPARFVPLVELYRESAGRAGHDPATLPVSINAHGFVADSAAAAAAAAWPPYLDAMGRIGRERGWPPPSRARFDAECGPAGALLVGGPQEVADKLLHQHALFGNQRCLIQLTVGATPHRAVMRAIELLGTEVAPVVRRETARRGPAPAAAPAANADGHGEPRERTAATARAGRGGGACARGRARGGGRAPREPVEFPPRAFPRPHSVPGCPRGRRPDLC
jgi:probable LLM family oxidoreductase